MTEYGIAWYPRSDNLGDDLRTLAAVRLMPRVDRVLDADCLDAPLSGLREGDRLVALLSGSVLRSASHWPPEEHIAPVCVGVHASAEDVWGLPFESLDGAGRRYLSACAPVGCRDDRTVRLMEKIGVPHELTACLTLTLSAPENISPSGKPYVLCVDIPDEAVQALREAAHAAEADIDSTITHQRTGGTEDFQQRMKAAQALVERYAGARFVITRRLHCAMACLAVNTPVLLLYNSGYEDVTRFAPMDQMMRTMPVDDFIRQIRQDGFPKPWANPPGVEAWRERLTQAVQEGIARAEAASLPLIPPGEGAAWQLTRLRQLAASSAEKIQRLEREQYTALHEKFSLLLREDNMKNLLTPLLDEPEVRRGMERVARRRCLAALPWYKRPMAWARLRHGSMKTEDWRDKLLAQLSDFGWPERRN